MKLNPARRIFQKGSAVLLATAAGVSMAWADPVASGTVASVTAQAQSAGGPQFNQSTETITNGIASNVEYNGSTSGASNGSASITSGGTIYAPTLQIYQNGSTNNGVADATTSTAAVSLSAGAIHLNVSPNDPNGTRASSGFAIGSIGDNITFNNTTGSAVDLALSFSAHGSFSGLDPRDTHQVDAILQFYSSGGPGAVQLVTANGGPQSFGHYYAQYQLQGQYSPFYTHFSDNGGIGGGGAATLVDHSTGTLLDATIGAILYIPTGISTIDIGAQLATKCDGSWTCDLSNTGLLSFAPLVDGLSFTSDSGQFLTGNVGAVPEPSTWAMMLLGFAGMGFIAYRRKATPALMAA